jgi:hypothetical protein
MKSTLTLTTPHAADIIAGVAQSPRPYNRLTSLTADDGAVLIMTEHDAYVAGHEFDLIASGGFNASDLAEVHAWIKDNVTVPTRNA